VLYFIQRLRDEAHRFVIGSHRQVLRKKDIRETGLQEIAGIGPSRKRALAASFRNIEGDRARVDWPTCLQGSRASSAESARKIFAYFHARKRLNASGNMARECLEIRATTRGRHHCGAAG
jgi:excinuclease ABC subunit C